MYSRTRLYNAAASSPSRPREGDSLAIIYWYVLNVSSMLTDCDEDASIKMCENAQALA